MLFICILLFFLSVNAYCACTPYTKYWNGAQPSTCQNGSYNEGGVYCKDYESCGNIGYCVYTSDVSLSCGSNYYAGIYSGCYRCSSVHEKDSLFCVLDGGNYEYNSSNGLYECNTNTCDSTMHCNTFTRTRCLDVPASSQITCYNGQCSGLPYSMWWSEFVKECVNECGTHETTTTNGDTAVAFGYSCSDGEEECFNKVYCTEIDGNYILYKKCLVGREVVGNVDTRQQMPQIQYTAPGTCLENGYQSEKYEHSNGGVNSGNGGPIESQSDDCLVYGVGCSDNYKDTINYNEQNNKNPTNNCYCKPFDSMNSISQIVCPDGSVSIVYMSCKEWENMFRSSSSSGGGGGSLPVPPHPQRQVRANQIQVILLVHIRHIRPINRQQIKMFKVFWREFLKF